MKEPVVEVTVRPLRFSDDVPRMRVFYETLGLPARVESRRGGWLDMYGTRGMVALHEAATSDSGGRPGETRLSFEVADADALCRRLRDAGNESATVWDEAYGRVLSVNDPSGAQVWVDERSDDDYGYRRHAHQSVVPVEPVPVLHTSEPGAYCDFLALFHLEVRATDARRTKVSGRGGSAAVESAADGAPTIAVVDPEFETTEPLGDLADRMRDAGFAEVALYDDAVVVTDPDGCTTRINGSPDPAR